jgi:hypothetical protein
LHLSVGCCVVLGQVNLWKRQNDQRKDKKPRHTSISPHPHFQDKRRYGAYLYHLPPRRTISTPYLACNSITSPTFPIQSSIPTHQPGPKLTHLAYRQHFRSASYMLHLHMHDSTFNVKKKGKSIARNFPGCRLCRYALYRVVLLGPGLGALSICGKWVIGTGWSLGAVLSA